MTDLFFSQFFIIFIDIIATLEFHLKIFRELFRLFFTGKILFVYFFFQINEVHSMIQWKSADQITAVTKLMIKKYLK